MSYNITQYCAGDLGDPSQNLEALSEPPNFHNYFTLCDFCVTITLKGAHSLRNYENDIKYQHIYLSSIIDDIISTYSKSHFFTFELHKCGGWLHAHGILSMVHRSKMPILKKLIYKHIEKKALPKGSTYKHRVLIEKVYNVDNWTEYIMKDVEVSTYLQLKYKYKLFSQPNIYAYASAQSQSPEKSISTKVQVRVSKTPTSTQLQEPTGDPKVCISQQLPM